MSTPRGLAALLALAISCGGGDGPEARSADDEAARAAGDGDEAACAPREDVQHPSYSSDNLRLELVETGAPAPLVVEPVEFEPIVEEDLAGSIDMELTIHDPSGRTHVQRFTYRNTHEVCDGICDRVVGGDPCPPRRCWTERFRPPPVRIDPQAYRSSLPGEWTFVLHRLDDGDRTSVTRRLFESETIEGEACEALPLALGPFRRVSCRNGVVPTGTSTTYWGLSARYEDGDCRVNAFALRLGDNVRAAFHEGPYGAAETRSFAEGEVHELDLGGATVRAWLAHHHAYIVAAREGTPRYDEFVAAFLAVFPDVGGPVREVPSCEETLAVTERTVAPQPIERLVGDEARFHTHYEGNRPSGARVAFHDQHALAHAGLRRHEIVQTVDGDRVRDRRAFLAVLERMTRPGSMELVVSRERVRHARCIRLRIVEGGAAPDAGTPPPDAGVQPPPPPPPPDTGGRHCERRSDDCWDCVDITFPAEIGCERCRGRDICITQSGSARCLAPTRVCCLPGTPCNTPPGCEGLVSSCSSEAPSGRNDHCTFLGTCPTPLPSVRGTRARP